MRHLSTLDVGWDVPQESMAVASVAQAHGAEVISLGSIGTRQADIDPLPRTLHSKAQPLVFVDEAGPCGAWLSRDLRPKGDDCWVVTLWLIPKQAGDRVNTDRREAMPVARLMRSGALTPVDVPQGVDAAIRARCRARADASRGLKAANFRLKAIGRRHDLRDTGQATWRPVPSAGFAGVHHVTHSVFPLARAPGAAPRGQYFSACFTPLRYRRRMTPMRRGGQDRLGHDDHSCLTTFTSHLEAVSSRPWVGAWESRDMGLALLPHEHPPLSL